MKKIIKFILLATIYVISFGCENVTTDETLENASQTSEISLKEFKLKTGLEKVGSFDSSPSQADISYRTPNLKKYEIDTISVKEHKYGNNKTSFSFRIYPKDKILKVDEAYNLIYVKSKNKWETCIIHFKYKSSNNDLQNSNVAMQSRGEVFQYLTTTLSHHCTKTGPCANGTCDGCNRCVTYVVTYSPLSGVGGGGYSLGIGSYTPVGTPGTGPADGGDFSDPNEVYIFAPNINESVVFGTREYINQNNAILFYNTLHYDHKRWAHQNNAEYQSLIGYQMQNVWSDESSNFARDMVSLLAERDWKTDLKQAISTGITASAELTHKLYTRLSQIALAHPSSIGYINIVVDGIRDAVASLIDINPSTCTWTDLFNMWMFELGPTPTIFFNGPSTTLNSLQTQQGVSQARAKALNQITNGNLSSIPTHGWTYGQPAFYDGMVNGNIATSFLGSYNTDVKITALSSGQHKLTFTVRNPSTWDSATRLRIDNNNDDVHDGIFPNHNRNASNTLHIGGNFNQIWTWSETH